jgi:regulator of RNase E activity RraB
MGLFDSSSREPKRFVSQRAFETNLEKQMTMTPQTLHQLRGYGVTPDKRRRLEFFFYTNTIDKAAALAAELTKQKYDVEYGPSASDAKIQVIKGWTPQILMSDAAVLAWTKEMCTVGFGRDCDFDGWGTNAE